MMLPLPNLDDQNVAEIINQALDEVRKHSGIWNDTDVHDPGVTLLELFASIKSTQQSSINTIGSRNLMKFLALLDIKAEKLSSAAVDVCFFSNNFKRLPVGLKFSSGSITYETAETVDVLPNRISCAASAGDIPDNLIDYDMRDIDRNIEVFNNNVNEYFYIGLENPLIKKRKIRLYFCLNENGIKRNPPSPEFEPLSKINWQYYGTEKGVLGWHNTHVESDETYNLLYSGYTVLKIRGTSAVYEDKNCYFLRLHCTKYGYEQPPRLSYVMFNAVKLLQKETLCSTVDFDFLSFEKNKLFTHNYLAKNSTYHLFINTGKNNFVMAQTLDVDYMLLKQEKGGYRLGTSKREELFELFTDRKPEEIVLKLILYDETFYNRRILGSSNGSANQEFKVKDEKNLCYDDFELMVANNDKWKVWKKTETLDNSFNNEENYVLNTQNAAVRFGDNINGKAPTPGENSIIITSASTTLGQNGSIKAFAISGNCDTEDFSDIEIFQFRNSIGGRSAETPQELILKAQQSINTVSRAVGVSDYKRLAMQTPGLKLSQVTVVPLYKPGLVGYPEIKAENCITLVIEPYNGNIEKTAVQGYIKNVQNYMEQYRLLTTRIFVTAPVYVPIDVYAEIWVSANTPELSKKIRADIEHYINKMQAERLGATLYNGDIANTLETIDEVKLLKYFYMEISEDTAIKNRFGDIILLPPTRAYLRQCSITFNV